MNKDQFAGKWHEIKGKIKEKWGKFTDDDLQQINGKWEAFVGIMQKRYGIAREQAEQDLNRWCDECSKEEKKRKAG